MELLGIIMGTVVTVLPDVDKYQSILIYRKQKEFSRN